MSMHVRLRGDTFPVCVELSGAVAGEGQPSQVVCRWYEILDHGIALSLGVAVSEGWQVRIRPAAPGRYGDAFDARAKFAGKRTAA